jgi:aspartyl-tRNA(Asn)/glutamyl-tRNA(Gln) amidotransferase subunit A
MEWNKILTDSENKKKYVEYVKEWESKIHSLLEFNPDRAASSGAGSNKAASAQAVSGIPYVAKDNIAVKEYRLTCSSQMLKDFISPYDATVIEKLNAAGAVPVGKCNMPEFGMDAFTNNSAMSVTNNPWDLQRVAGGCGAGAAVAAGIVPFALGSDTGGAVRRSAAFCGVYGLKPTYGAVSRYGLAAYASSLDVIGILSRELSLVEKIFDLIKGKDNADQTTVDYPTEEKSLPQKSIFAYLGGDIWLSEPVKQGYKNCIDILKAKGHEVKEVTLPALASAAAIA